MNKLDEIITILKGKPKIETGCNIGMTYPNYPK